jgi:large subunit ribosomal protein L1
MGKQSKRYVQSAESRDAFKLHRMDEAIEIMAGLPKTKFDESVDMAIRLGVDPKHADQMVRGAIVLPHGTGSDVRILVFAKGDKEQEARDAGADFVGGQELAQKIQDDGWMEFDRVIATPDMMGVVGRLGRVLGPRGLMPNPKLGTVTPDVARAVEEQKAGKVEYRVDKTGIVHCKVGKASFSAEQLLGNSAALLNAIVKAKPSSSKGTYIRSISISTTMGPGFRIDPAAAQSLKAA